MSSSPSQSSAAVPCTSLANLTLYVSSSPALNGTIYSPTLRKGRVVPVFASALLDANAAAAKEGREPVNLQSILMVNGFTNYLTCASCISVIVMNSSTNALSECLSRRTTCCAPTPVSRLYSQSVSVCG